MASSRHWPAGEFPSSSMTYSSWTTYGLVLDTDNLYHSFNSTLILCHVIHSFGTMRDVHTTHVPIFNFLCSRVCELLVRYFPRLFLIQFRQWLKQKMSVGTYLQFSVVRANNYHHHLLLKRQIKRLKIYCHKYQEKEKLHWLINYHSF